MKNQIKALIINLKAGKKEYFNEFYNLTKSSVYYMIIKYVHTNENAQDVMQDTYISFINSLNNLDDNQNGYNYLLTIAKNKAINYITRQRPTEDIIGLEIADKNPFDNLDAPLLNLCQQRLSLEEWQMLERCILLGYTQVEVAKEQGKSISTFNWRFKKLLSKISKLYKEAYYE